MRTGILLLVALSLCGVSSAQLRETTLTPVEEAYAFEKRVMSGGVSTVNVGGQIYEVVVAAQAETALWAEIWIRVDGKVYDFRTTKYGPSNRQVAHFDVGKMYNFGSKVPFSVKMGLASRSKKDVVLKIFVHPKGKMSSCITVGKMMVLRYSSDSYLMCNRNKDPAVLRFSPNPSYGGMLDNAGYDVYLKTENRFTSVGGFSDLVGSGVIRLIERTETVFSFKKVSNDRSGEYASYTSMWSVSAYAE